MLRGDSATVDLLATRMGRKELGEALVRSVFGNRPEQVRRLLAHGANVNFVDDIGMTPLLYAASIDYGDTEMIETLLKAGADASIRAKDGSTALGLARKYNHRELQAMLERAAGFK